MFEHKIIFNAIVSGDFIECFYNHSTGVTSTTIVMMSNKEVSLTVFCIFDGEYFVLTKKIKCRRF